MEVGGTCVGVDGSNVGVTRGGVAVEVCVTSPSVGGRVGVRPDVGVGPGGRLPVPSSGVSGRGVLVSGSGVLNCGKVGGGGDNIPSFTGIHADNNTPREPAHIHLDHESAMFPPKPVLTLADTGAAGNDTRKDFAA